MDCVEMTMETNHRKQLPVNPNATKEARELLDYLNEVAGKQIITGQHTQTVPMEEVTYIKGGTTIEMWIGKTDIKINGKTKTIDAAPQLTAGRTLVPIRFVMENLGAELKWDNDEKKVTIIY